MRFLAEISLLAGNLQGNFPDFDQSNASGSIILKGFHKLVGKFPARVSREFAGNFPGIRPLAPISDVNRFVFSEACGQIPCAD